jgi:hypothetical protein
MPTPPLNETCHRRIKKYADVVRGPGDETERALSDL